MIFTRVRAHDAGIPAREAVVPRWAELVRAAEQTVILADFERNHLLPSPSPRSRSPATSPLRRERALVCDVPDHPACVAGWEPPG
jgi:hypothetical protein